MKHPPAPNPLAELKAVLAAPPGAAPSTTSNGEREQEGQEGQEGRGGEGYASAYASVSPAARLRSLRAVNQTRCWLGLEPLPAPALPATACPEMAAARCWPHPVETAEDGF